MQEIFIHTQDFIDYINTTTREVFAHKDTSSGLIRVYTVGHQSLILYTEMLEESEEYQSILDRINIALPDPPLDRSGKLRVHQTSRRLGTVIGWYGRGDDPSDPTNVGGGTPFTYSHTTGENEPVDIYIDINCVENETWLHEGYLTWKGCHLDTVSLSVVSRATSTITSSGTYYNLYNGYLIVPAAGDGTIQITSDITTHSGGLVYMPNDDLDNPPTAFWNADWNTSTKRYENITAAPAGDGRYNMFPAEITLAKFVHAIPLLESGFIALNSSDTDQLGHGMRIKMTADTNNDIPDHDWAIACTMCMHRKRTM